MARDTQKYAGCWYCDNIIDHPEQVGLLHLGFVKCHEFFYFYIVYSFILY